MVAIARTPISKITGTIKWDIDLLNPDDINSLKHLNSLVEISVYETLQITNGGNLNFPESRIVDLGIRGSILSGSIERLPAHKADIVLHYEILGLPYGKPIAISVKPKGTFMTRPTGNARFEAIKESGPDVFTLTPSNSTIVDFNFRIKLSANPR
ncbi:hypothetical protein [Niabella aquatica]